MRKALIRPLLVALALGLAPALALALEVPAGKAAVIEAVLGRVKLSSQGKTSAPKVGQALDYGDSLDTGANGRVSLRHAGNAVSRLAPNTELTLKAPGKKKGTFLGLSQGVIRFLVGKREPGHSFEVSTHNAVAAVKGTDAEVETDGKSTRSSVFSSAREQALELLNSATGKSVFLSPGQLAGLDDEGFKTRELNREDFERSEGRFEGLPDPDVEGGEGGDGVGGRAGTDTKSPDPDSGQGAVTFAEAISDAFESVMEDLGLDNVLERDERTGDLVAGRIAFDRNGDRTVISSYVLRSDPVTVVKASYSKRDSGPFQGTSYAEEASVWNTALPEDWTSVARQALNSPANLNAAGEPIYWRESQYFIAGNPQGDTMEVLRDYQRPYFEYDPNGGANPVPWRGPNLLPQGFTQGLWLNDILVHAFQWLANTAPYVTENLGGAMVATNPAVLGGSGWSTSVSLGEGNNVLSLDYSVAETSFLLTEVRILDNAGALQNITDIVTEPSYLRDFRGIDNAYNIEVTFRSALFTAPIDLLVIPEIFDHFDFFDMPSSYGSGV